jgi:hypothetical protein
MTYGFIITRHVNSLITNKYWNQCVKLIRTFYPFKQIIIIDDNSNQSFVSADCNYKNIEIIQSEYPKRGELLPYLYFLKYKWFDNAVIMHDSVFIHKRIPFELFTYPVLPLWHHAYDKDNLQNLQRICSNLKNNLVLRQKLNLSNSNINILGLNDNDKFNLCFGVQSYINLHFLEMLENKYNITNLTSVIKNRSDRCGLERIMGLLFCQEYPKLKQKGSVFGNIHRHHRAFKYNYNNYLQDLNKKKACGPFVKVWTGR